jgi:hypothetical protein
VRCNQAPTWMSLLVIGFMLYRRRGSLRFCPVRKIALLFGERDEDFARRLNLQRSSRMGWNVAAG